MISLTVCNHKGGTGKTTSIINLAAAFGLSGMKVLAVDLDPQGFLSRMMGEGDADKEESSAMLFDPLVAPDDIPRRPMDGFDLIASSPILTSELRRLNKGTDVLWLKDFSKAMSEKYDLLLYDTAAALTVFSLNAMVASNHVLIPVCPEYQPIIGAEQVFQTCMMVRKKLNPSLRKPKFLFTMVDARKRSHAQYRRYLRGKYEDDVMRTIIRTSAALATSDRDGRTVFASHPRARGSIDYANAADELLSSYLNSDTQRTEPTALEHAGV
jgi:chromosome partitioning protein